MKPMKLETFPYVERWTADEVTNSRGQVVEMSFREKGYEVGGQVIPASPEEKRIADAELAAEFESARCDAMLLSEAGRYYAALGDTWPKDEVSVHRRAMTLLRFATLPHYDEVPE